MNTKESHRHRRSLVILLVASGLIAGGVGYWVRSSHGAPETSVPVRETVTSNAAPAPAGGYVSSPVAIVPPSVEEAPKPVHLNPEQKRRKEMYERRPELKRFVELRAKVVRTDDEAREYGKLLQDPQRIHAAKEDLTRISENDLDESRQLQRIFQINFLDSALSWKANPARPEVLDAVKDAIRTNPIDSWMTDELKKSLVGDKMELVMILRGTFPEEADAIRQDLRRSPIAKVIEAGERRAEMFGVTANSKASL